MCDFGHTLLSCLSPTSTFNKLASEVTMLNIQVDLSKTTKYGLTTTSTIAMYDLGHILLSNLSLTSTFNKLASEVSMLNIPVGLKQGNNVWLNVCIVGYEFGHT